MNFETFDSKGLCEKKMVKLLERVKTSQGFLYQAMEKEICFVKESSSTVALFYKNKIVHKGSTMSDYYGYLKSVESSVEDAKKMEKEYDLTPEDLMEVRVLTSITETPALVAEKKRLTPFNNDSYKNIPNGWFYDTPAVQDIITKLKKIPQNTDEWFEQNQLLQEHVIETKTVIEDAETYSSKKAQNFDPKKIREKFNK